MNSEEMLLRAIEQGEAPVVRSLVNSGTNVLARIAASDDDALTVLVSEEYYNFSHTRMIIFLCILLFYVVVRKLLKPY